MARPLTKRRVQPGISRCVFRPAGIRAGDRAHVTLGLDEVEAIRLADLQGLYHESAARLMGVSRQTFGRIVESARRAIADAIINRKCLRIEGGQIVVQRSPGGSPAGEAAVFAAGRKGAHHGAHR